MKKILALLLSVLIIISLAACNGSSKNELAKSESDKIMALAQTHANFAVHDLLGSKEAINKDELDILNGNVKFGEPLSLEKLIGTQKIYGVKDQIYNNYSELLSSKEENYAKTLYSDETFGGIKYIELRGSYNATYKEQIDAGQWNLVDSNVDFTKIFCIDIDEENKSANDSFQTNKNLLEAVLDKFGRPDHLYVFANNEDGIAEFKNGVEYLDDDTQNDHSLYLTAVWGTKEGRLSLNIEDKISFKKNEKGAITSNESLTFLAITYVPKSQFADEDAINETAVDYYNQ